ncbi:MAG: L-arabinose isomerase [Kiritimatiellaeota bacterium]|nr:L-arabinose isomerase [Kiritimatiellota bacterium]
MINLKQYEVWFATGSQHLYGAKTLQQVATHSQQIAKTLGRAVPVKVVCQPVLTTPEAITQLCREANNAPNCAGLICWMHTFSPAKMWIAGLTSLRKPLVHLHTQFNREIPWAAIDMNFMNLNQAAHGDREFGFLCTRLRKNRAVVVGYWQDADVQDELNAWSRAAAAWADAQGGKIARFGDNMREVAVTEGDKVEAQMRFGYSVNGYGVGELVQGVNQVSKARIEHLVKKYLAEYRPGPGVSAGMDNLRAAAQIELGLRDFLTAGGFKGFTTTFEDLHGLKQLPGLAVQRLMADGYGFGAEGDWKTAALLRAMKVMAAGLPGGTSFMEDYTYHLVPGGMQVLGAHMLEVCPSIAAGQPSLEIHPLGIGGKADPARLVFNVPAGAGLNASLIDLGHRFRLIVNEVDVVEPSQDLPQLPVARAVWVPRPNLKVAAAAWIYAGGAHHTGFTQALTAQHLELFAELAGIECIHIGADASVSEIKQALRWNEAYYTLAKS